MAASAILSQVPPDAPRLSSVSAPSAVRRLLDAFNRRFARVHTRIYRSTQGWIGHRMTGRVKSLMLHTTGRRSGIRRTVVLAYGRDGERYVVVASNFGGERPPAWLCNLEAAAQAEINVGHRRLAVTAEIWPPGTAEYDRLFALADAAVRGRYQRYRAMTARPIPVVRLVPGQ